MLDAEQPMESVQAKYSSRYVYNVRISSCYGSILSCYGFFSTCYQDNFVSPNFSPVNFYEKINILFSDIF